MSRRAVMLPEGVLEAVVIMLRICVRTLETMELPTKVAPYVSTVDFGSDTTLNMELASLYAVTNAFRLFFTVVVSRVKSKFAAPEVVVNNSRVVPAMASVTLLVLEEMATPLTVRAAFCAV